MENANGISAYLKAAARFGNVPAVLMTRHGKPYMPSMLPTGISRGKPQSCFMNATLLAAERSDLTYVEGLAFSEYPVPVSHAWCIDRDGHVIDTTWPFVETARYFGIALKTAPVLALVREKGVYGLFDSPVFWSQAWDLKNKAPTTFWFDALADHPSERIAPPGDQEKASA
ncbi:hypothetical protein F6X40_23795 [Paraburkholderia sp. UCT31]|uniref:hypothetical protein n=1 Tax=Paraburkholderia sp. UCT31 TaxID=2615209 RepID=UPI001656752E|nr:hypothetical protein [Paraburkholderia sp. UCT31]MBC8739740.1 hypothetical protein [Paraburkholderia sp. UCT31]